MHPTGRNELRPYSHFPVFPFLFFSLKCIGPGRAMPPHCARSFIRQQSLSGLQFVHLGLAVLQGGYLGTYTCNLFQIYL